MMNQSLGVFFWVQEVGGRSNGANVTHRPQHFSLFITAYLLMYNSVALWYLPTQFYKIPTSLAFNSGIIYANLRDIKLCTYRFPVMNVSFLVVHVCCIGTISDKMQKLESLGLLKNKE